MPLEARALRVAPRDDGFFYLTGALKRLVIGHRDRLPCYAALRLQLVAPASKELIAAFR